MKHLVYLDFKDKELNNLLSGAKTMIIRGAMGKKLPYGRVKKGEQLYFINNNGEGMVKAQGVVKNVLESEKLTKENSLDLVKKHLEALRIGDKLMNRFAGKRFIVLIEVGEVNSIEPFEFDRSKFGNMDDWIPFQTIEEIKK
jgi:hypothetical protein